MDKATFVADRDAPVNPAIGAAAFVAGCPAITVVVGWAVLSLG